MATVGLVTEPAPRHFALSAAGHRLLPNTPDTARESVANLDTYLTWLDAADVFRTGRPAERDYFAGTEDPAAFLRRMRDHAARCYGDLPAHVDWTRSEVVLDIGGGDGFVLDRILDHAPHLTGVLFDRPQVIDTLTATARRHLAAGDFFAHLPPGADTHLLCSVLHNWNDEQATTLLARSRAALGPSGRLLIIEMPVPRATNGTRASGATWACWSRPAAANAPSRSTATC
ncbi:methyltransferase [Catenulispora yoronensis]